MYQNPKRIRLDSVDTRLRLIQDDVIHRDYDLRLGLERTVYQKNKLSVLLYFDIIGGVSITTATTESRPLGPIENNPNLEPYLDPTLMAFYTTSMSSLGFLGAGIGTAVQYQLNNSSSISANCNFNMAMDFNKKLQDRITGDFFRLQLNYYFN